VDVTPGGRAEHDVAAVMQGELDKERETIELEMNM